MMTLFHYLDSKKSQKDEKLVFEKNSLKNADLHRAV